VTKSDHISLQLASMMNSALKGHNMKAQGAALGTLAIKAFSPERAE
jgi:hypothetical protein